jgi:hypothetical protein
VLDVHWKPGVVKLAAHTVFHPSGFQAAWMSWAAIDEAAARADAVDGYLDAVIPKRPPAVPPSRVPCRQLSPRSTPPIA